VARVRVLARKPLRGGQAAEQTAAYCAEIYEDFYALEPIWTCRHDHRSAVEAQLCGVRFLTDTLVKGRRARVGGAG
jgi:hypothetical protein